jgi:hypothetical protein
MEIDKNVTEDFFSPNQNGKHQENKQMRTRLYRVGWGILIQYW